MIPMGRPLLPPAKLLTPYLERIDASRWYTNAGPLVREYEERMGALFKCHVAATSSGTSGLTASLIALDEHGDMYLPSWTFVATANAVRAAGGRVVFTDVDELTWMPNDADIVVSIFGAPVEYEDEVMTDAAGAFDAYATGLCGVGEAPVVVSTHCTKTFSTGEGGLVLSTNKDLIDRIHAVINHGLDDARAVEQAGINGKMSEYHAAVGLAELDNWAWKRSKWLDLKRRYVEAFGSLVHTTPLSSLSWVGSIFCIRFFGGEGDYLREHLLSRGISSRKVWGDGVHRYAAYRDCERENLATTETLANEVVFLPYSLDTTDEELEKIVAAVGEVA